MPGSNGNSQYSDLFGETFSNLYENMPDNIKKSGNNFASIFTPIDDSNFGHNIDTGINRKDLEEAIAASKAIITKNEIDEANKSADKILSELQKKYDEEIKDPVKISNEEKVKESGYKVHQYVDDNIYKSNNTFGISDDINGDLSFFLPHYGVEDYLLDRASWQKQLYSVTGEPGWFYFKIFFHFNTNYGLLGGILNSETVNQYVDYDYLNNLDDFHYSNDKDAYTMLPRSVNTAIGYLSSIKNRYEQEKINDRMLALYKFVGSLSFISCEAPWFFKGISGLNNIKSAYTSDFHKDKFINIQCAEEAVDMRLGTLIDLYKYACYDNINCKEIIPANLRKFDMSILLFHVPIKFHHTKVGVNINENGVKKDLGFKETPNTNDISSQNISFSNSISFKLYSFMNCEIDADSLNGWSGDTLNNESPFTLGKNSIKINYDRVYEHRMNEWDQMMFGSDGFYYNVNDFELEYLGGFDNTNSFKLNTPKRNKFEERERFLSSPLSINNLNEYSEHIISRFVKERYEVEGNSRAYQNFYPLDMEKENLNSTSSTYYRDKLIDLKNNFGALLSNYSTGNLYGTFTQVKSQYFKNKLKWFKEGTISSGNLYNYDLGRTGDLENRKNTRYLNEKIEALKNGTSNQKNLDISTFGKKNEFKLEWASETAKNSFNTFNKAGLYDENKSWFRNLVDSVWGQTKATFGF